MAERHPSSRKRFETDVLEGRLSVLDEQGHVSILVVIDSGYQSYLVANENLGNGSVDQKLHGYGIFPGEVVWMKGLLYHEWMFATQ